MKKPEILRLIRLNFFKLLGAAYFCCPRMAYTQPDIRIGELTYQLKGQLPSFGGFGAAGAWLDRGQKLSDVLDRFFPGSSQDDEDEFKF